MGRSIESQYDNTRLQGSLPATLRSSSSVNFGVICLRSAGRGARALLGRSNHAPWYPKKYRCVLLDHDYVQMIHKEIDCLATGAASSHHHAHAFSTCMHGRHRPHRSHIVSFCYVVSVALPVYSLYYYSSNNIAYHQPVHRYVHLCHCFGLFIFHKDRAICFVKYTTTTTSEKNTAHCTYTVVRITISLSLSLSQQNTTRWPHSGNSARRE
jgi:hypothetical protein